MNLDPYLDIEDILDEPAKELVTVKQADPSGLFFDCFGGHVLWKRKRRYSSDRDRRSSSKDTFYHDMCADEPPRKQRKSFKRVVKEKPGLKDPSIARLRSQQQIIEAKEKKRKGITDEAKLVQLYPLFKPVRAKTEESDHEPDNAAYDSDNTLPAPVDEKPKNDMLMVPLRNTVLRPKPLVSRNL